MTRRAWLAAPAALAALPLVAAAQIRVDARSSVFYESYTFDTLIVFNRVSELTVPVGVNIRFGTAATMSLSGGYAQVDLRTADPAQLANQTISGPLDTEARLSLNVVPGKLVALFTGVIPTGTKAVQLEELAVLGAISSDVIGFASSNLGTGGNVGGGFAGAIPVGKFALGFGATYKQPMAYVPVLGETDQLKPGGELRLRSGLEGSVARRTYMRLAGIYVRTQKDKIALPGVGDSTKHGVGNRIIGYVSVNQGLGAGSVTLYGFDVFRGDPQIEQTAQGAALLPRGNLLAVGGRIDWPVGQRLIMSPQAELRLSAAAPDTTVTALERLGQSLRIGTDVRFDEASTASLVLQGGVVTGYVVQSGTNVKLSGYRVSLHLELRP